MDALNKLYKIAEDEDIAILYRKLSKKAISGKDLQGNPYIFIKNTICLPSTLTRLLGEEIGHCVTGSFYSVYPRAPISLIKANADRAESAANKWAIEHILPLEELEKAIADNPYNLGGVARDLNLDYSYVVDAIEYYRKYSLLDENLWE